MAVILLKNRIGKNIVVVVKKVFLTTFVKSDLKLLVTFINVLYKSELIYKIIRGL